MTTNTNGQTIVDLEEIPLKEIWEKEAINFTPWLSDNISRVSDKIGMDLSVIECEKSVGPFFGDIYAEDEKGNKVIIENQLTQTDHEHLGKMLTYAAGLKGKTMIWIAGKVRPEHAATINWLNTMDTDIQFYLIELTAHRIDEINVTIDLNMVCEPNNMTETIREKFWTQLKRIDSEHDNIFLNVNNFKYDYMETKAMAGASWDIGILVKSGKAQLYIHDDKELYKSIEKRRTEIETDFGEPLEWINNEKHKVTRITTTSNIGGLKDEDKWDDIQHDLVDRMSRLKNAISKYLE